MNNQTILLIDYDPASISKTATPLTKAGYQVEVAKDGLSGLAAFERMKPALVLVEAMLPRKHGFEVCQEIKAQPGGKSTPVLITTAVCRGRKYRMDALQIYGCDEYIEKPITDDELLSMIGRFIQQANEAREEIKQDLSDAIDTASADAPVAIETMGDDELEAKIDALLVGDDGPGAEEEILAPPVAQAATAIEDKPVETSIAVAPEAPPSAAGDPTDQQLDALFQTDPAKIDQPAGEVASLPVEAPATADAPAGESAADPLIAEIESSPEPEPAPASEVPHVAPAETVAGAVPEPTPREWTETSSQERKGPPKAILFGAAAVVVLGVAGFFAFQQGWVGGGVSTGPDPVETAGIQKNPAPATPEPALNPPAQDVAAQVEIETDPGLQPERAPVTAQPEPPQPKPVLPPKPTYKPRSAAELQAARQREEQAARALQNVAGSLQSELLSGDVPDPATARDEPVQAIDINEEVPLGEPVRPKARRGELVALEDVDRIPVPVRFEQPIYDEMARRSNQEGVVIVEVLIDETGKVTETRLVQEIPRSRLNEATLRAARRWSYQPAVKDGVPVKVWKSESIVFELE